MRCAAHDAYVQMTRLPTHALPSSPSVLAAPPPIFAPASTAAHARSILLTIYRLLRSFHAGAGDIIIDALPRFYAAANITLRFFASFCAKAVIRKDI